MRNRAVLQKSVQGNLVYLVYLVYLGHFNHIIVAEETTCFFCVQVEQESFSCNCKCVPKNISNFFYARERDVNERRLNIDFRISKVCDVVSLETPQVKLNWTIVSLYCTLRLNKRNGRQTTSTFSTI